jgi:SSS family solute:Na+ symporter
MERLAVALAIYVLVVVAVGAAATRRASRSPEEYYLAGRGLGTLVLFMALFGTNVTTFVLVGIPGLAYHAGVGVFGLNAPVIALGIPLTFYLLGVPARRMAIRLGALTPAELYARRFGSRAAGIVLVAAFTLYTLPYMVQAVHGAAVTLAAQSSGAIPEWLGGAAVMAVALLYTALGGMRATAWTNVVQGALFLAFMVAAFVLIAHDLGGPRAAMQKVAEHDPSLLVRNDHPAFEPRAWASYGLAISLTVIAFPHMFVRLMAARDEATMRAVCRLYPPALLLLWLPAVLIGVWGAAVFPGLEGSASDRIFSLMTGGLGAWFGVFAVLAVLAAVMSTLDAQVLTLGSMFARDVVGSAGAGRRGVRAGRVFSAAVAALVLLLAWLARALDWSVFRISAFAFSGYVTLVPALYLGLRWRRCTAAGAVASIAAGNAVLLAGESGVLPTFGFLPVLPAFFAALATAVAVSLATRPADPATIDAAFGDPRSSPRPIMGTPQVESGGDRARSDAKRR